jgi:hypothetical protein
MNDEYKWKTVEIFFDKKVDRDNLKVKYIQSICKFNAPIGVISQDEIAYKNEEDRF